MSASPVDPAPSRPRGTITVRVLLALLALVGAYFSLSYTIANVVSNASPLMAHRLAPLDGQTTALAAQEEFEMRPTGDPSSEAARLAVRALAQDGTAVKALSVLGLQAQLRNDMGGADGIFAYTLRLTRRELRPSLWAIERDVELGDIGGALRTYDIVLRTSRDGSDLLFPVLGRALAEPKVRAALLQLLETKPSWTDEFINYLAAHPEKPQAIAQFFREGKQIKLPVDELDRAAIVNALVAQGRYDDAWSYYSAIQPGVVRDRSRDTFLAKAADAPTSFDWTPMSGPGLSAVILRGAQGAFDFSASTSAGGVVLQQLELLPAGKYKLEGHSLGIDQSERSLPYWTLVCAGSRELGRVTVPNSDVANGSFSGVFNVPSGCPTQLLALVLRPSDDVSGVSGQIDRVRLAPAE